jgi:ribA/ribD-fused uncharacterized protein
LGNGKLESIRADWEEVKLDIMREIIKLKFDQNESLSTLLRNTGNATLVENAPWDNYWGNGRGKDGQNWLGRILMEYRDNRCI